MVDEPNIPTDVSDNIERSNGSEPNIKRSAARRSKTKPSYQMVGKSKVPVNSSTGTLWKSRVEIARKQTDSLQNVWDEAVRYFENDQSDHRVSRNGSGNVVSNQRLNDHVTETENVVFANVTVMTPALYSKNPRAEFTAGDNEQEELAGTLEDLVNAIFQRRSSPGINLKPKAKRCVVTSLLTNRSWLELGWIFRDDSSEKALQDLSELGKALEKAKTTKETEEIEGKLSALEEKIDFLSPPGPTLKVKQPGQVLIDPAAQEVDLTDARWIAIEDYLPTQFLMAKYGEKSGSEYKSIYKSTHVLKLGTKDKENEEEFSLFADDKPFSEFGFDDEESFIKAQVTKVWMVWDKVTRRVLMFNDNDWKWPMWVWDDPYHLDTFFPLFPLTFFESPKGILTKGEVTYYLDQQDAINEIVDEKRRALKWARRNVFFDSGRINKEDVEAVLNGDDGTARGIKLPDGTKLSDVLFSFVPPSMQFEKLFDKEDKYAAINRISSVSEVLQGAPFKSNTNRQAVEATTSASNMRIDEKTDQIEDWIGAVAWGVAQLCLQFMEEEQVTALIGEGKAANWRNMSFTEIQGTLSYRVIGGSSKKPTSAAKKEEALELGQVLGQFVNAAPMVLIIMLKVLQEAFDEINIKEEDWQQIIDSVNQNIAGQGQGQPQPQQGGQPPQEGQPQQQGVDQGQIEQILGQMPPEIKSQIVEQIKAGGDPQQLVQQAAQQLSQQQPQGNS